MTTENPKKAREKARLSPVALAAKVPCSLALVYRCEKTHRFPKQQAMRAAYFKALHLPVGAK